jgi:hypothetical protein
MSFFQSRFCASSSKLQNCLTIFNNNNAVF